MTTQHERLHCADLPELCRTVIDKQLYHNTLVYCSPPVWKEYCTSRHLDPNPRGSYVYFDPAMTGQQVGSIIALHIDTCSANQEHVRVPPRSLEMIWAGVDFTVSDIMSIYNQQLRCNLGILLSASDEMTDPERRAVFDTYVNLFPNNIHSYVAVGGSSLLAANMVDICSKVMTFCQTRTSLKEMWIHSDNDLRIRRFDDRC